MNRKAIVVYIDNNKRTLEEFTWLYKTWILHDLYEEYDILAFCNPLIVSKVPQHDNIVIKELEPLNKKGDIWHSYGFVNSFAMFNDSEVAEWTKSKYDYILKTDCDVFLTEHVKGLNPSKAMIGQGGYMEDGDVDEILLKLKSYSEKLNFRNKHMNHIGASIFAKTEEVIGIVKYHFMITKLILQTGWKQGEIGKWPGWFKGVASMYAIHIVINHFYGPQSCNLYSIDSRCWNLKIEKDVYHIHAWHTGEYWSKRKHFEGLYEKYVSDNIPEKAEEYCHWIASNTLEEILLVKK